MAYLYYKSLNQHRLGNALFMVASTIGIARANGMQPLFPANWKYRGVFNIPDSMFGDCRTEAVYKEPHFHFCAPEIDPNKNTELSGYFQSERYFHNIENEIKLYLTPKGSAQGSVDAVSIHHRRGDYVNNPNYQQLGMNYYISAYDTFFKGKEIRAFSDDINYISLHYGGNKLGLKQPDEMSDFINMVNCKYHICSNSTFSWWTAYLSGSDSVIRPFKYFAGSLADRTDDKDLWRVNWVPFDNNRKVDLEDMTFIIPFQHDHADRLQNIATVVDFICKHFWCCKFIGEVNTYMISLANGVDMFDEKYIMPNFHRTKVLNDLTKKAFTKYVFNWDADVITSPWQIYNAVIALRNGADICYPFTDVFANVPRQHLQPFFQTLDAGVFAGRMWPWMNSSYKSVGGAVGYNKESFLKAGGENEGFISYGPEDQERYMRFQKLGLKIEKIPGTIFHMEHWRGNNSCERHPDSRNNIALFEAEKKMTAEQMREYVGSELWGTNQIPKMINV